MKLSIGPDLLPKVSLLLGCTNSDPVCINEITFGAETLIAQSIEAEMLSTGVTHRLKPLYWLKLDIRSQGFNTINDPKTGLRHRDMFPLADYSCLENVSDWPNISLGKD